MDSDFVKSISDIYYQLNPDDGYDLGHATEIHFVNDTDMTFDLQQCTEDDVDWHYRITDGSEGPLINGHPPQTLGPRSTCDATGTSTTMGFNQTGQILWKDRNSDLVWKTWFKNPFASSAEIDTWQDQGQNSKYKQGCRQKDSPNRQDMRWDVVISKSNLCHEPRYVTVPLIVCPM